jgi:hypothetical protein
MGREEAKLVENRSQMDQTVKRQVASLSVPVCYTSVTECYMSRTFTTHISTSYHKGYFEFFEGTPGNIRLKKRGEKNPTGLIQLTTH